MKSVDVPKATAGKKLENDWHEFLAAIPNPKGKEERRLPSPIGDLRGNTAERKGIFAQILHRALRPGKKLENPADWHEFLAAIPNPKGKEERRLPSPIGDLRWNTVERKGIFAEILHVWFSNFSGGHGSRPAIASITSPPGGGKTHVASVMAGSGHVFLTDFSGKSAWVEDPEYQMAVDQLHSTFESHARWPMFQNQLKRAVGVAVSFNYLTEVSSDENIEGELSQMIGSRLVYSYFTRGNSNEAWDSFRSFLLKTEYFSVLTAEVALRMIRNDIGASETPLIIVLDELMRLMNTKWELKEQQAQVEKILGFIRPAYQANKNYLLLTSLSQAILETRAQSPILGPRLPTLTHKGVGEVLNQRNGVPEAFFHSPDFRSLIRENAGVPRIVEKTIAQFKDSTSHNNLDWQRKQISARMSVGRLNDAEKRKQAIICSMSLLRADVPQLIDEGYMYPLYSMKEFGVPPLFIMQWAQDPEFKSIPLLQAARGFVEHAQLFTEPALQSTAFEWQVAYLFLLRLWAVFHEQTIPTLWDLLKISKPPGARDLHLAQPKRFLEPLQCADISDQQDFLPTYGGPALHTNAGYDVIFPIECLDVGTVHVAAEVTLKQQNRPPQEIADKFEKSFYIYDEAKHLAGIKMSLFHRFSEGRIVFMHVGVREKQDTLDKCAQAWQKIKHVKEQIKRGKKIEDIKKQIEEDSGCGDGPKPEDRSLVERSMVHLNPTHYHETLVPPCLRFVSAHQDSSHFWKQIPKRPFSTRRAVHNQATQMASMCIRFLKR